MREQTTTTNKLIKKDLQITRQVKFGVEIEVIGIGDRRERHSNHIIQTIAQAIREEGVAVNGMSLTHDVTSYWKVLTDGSCGYEIVSPILYDFEDLEKVCKALKRVDARVDRTCGVHVHQDATGFKVENIKNVYRLYNKYSDVFDFIMPDSRRDSNNDFCKDISDNYLAYVESQPTISKLKDTIGARRQQQRTHYPVERYYKVNFCSYIQYGTIEFRQHSGTTDFDKIFNWVLITQMIMQRAEQNKKVVNFKEGSKYTLIQKYTQFNKECGITSTSVAYYIRTRYMELKKKFGVQ